MRWLDAREQGALPSMLYSDIAMPSTADEPMRIRFDDDIEHIYS